LLALVDSDREEVLVVDVLERSHLSVCGQTDVVVVLDGENLVASEKLNERAEVQELSFLFNVSQILGAILGKSASTISEIVKDSTIGTSTTVQKDLSRIFLAIKEGRKN
jgi:hypothetical protein